MNALSLTLVLCAGLSTCAGNLLLKLSRSAPVGDQSWLERFISAPFFGGLAFFGVGVVLFSKALDDTPVSVAYPILATTGFGVLTITAYVLFGERLSWMQFAGLLLALTGVTMLARG